MNDSAYDGGILFEENSTAKNKRSSIYKGGNLMSIINNTRSKKAMVFATTVCLSLSMISSPALAKSQHSHNTSKPLSYYLGSVSRYKQPVDISVGWNSEPGPVPGQTQTNNLYVSYIQKRLNVKFNWSFLTPGSELEEKQNLAIADNEMPDVMMVNKQQLEQLVQSGQVENLTSTFQKYASPYIKTIYSSNDNRALQEATFNGKLMAIPDTQVGLQFPELWIRQDWLNKLHLKPPKTTADIEHILKEFISHHMGGKNTVGLIGLGAPSNGFQGNPIVQYGSIGGWDLLFGQYGAYPGSWLDVDGKAEYGSVQPAAEKGLELVHQMYEEGLIDPQFATNTSAQEAAEVASGQSGMFYGVWWAPFYPLYTSVEENPNAKWVPYLAPLTAQGKVNVLAPPWSEGYVVVKKGFAHPDAIMKIINLGQAGQRFYDPASANFYDRKDTSQADWPLVPQLDWYNSLVVGYNEITTALKTHSTSGVEPRFITYYENYLESSRTPDPSKDIAAWENANSYVTGVQPIAENYSNIHQTEPLNVVIPQNMSAQWAEMQKIESETYLQIVLGQKPISAFNTFVQEWNALGGQQITQYIQQNMKDFK